MNQFIQKYDEKVTGTLSGWDRAVLRGTLRMLCFVDGMMGYLSRVGVLLKDFGEHAQAVTGQLIAASLAAAEEARRPIEYLESPKTRKDEYARNIALDDDIQDGLICVLTCVEPCKSYEIYRNRHKKILELKPRIRKCKFLYHYWIDPRLESISDGKLAVGGFCNRDVARQLYPPADDDPAERRRIASKVSYRLRILRAHGLIRKSPGRRRYHVTTKGREIITALSRSQYITLQQLNATAA